MWGEEDGHEGRKDGVAGEEMTVEGVGSATVENGSVDVHRGLAGGA